MAWLAEPCASGSLPNGILNEKPQVKVDKFVASTAYPKLYCCIGAVSDLAESSLGPNQQGQAATIAKNILKPGSAPYDGVPLKKLIAQLIGSDTFGMLIPSSVNVPSCCSTCCSNGVASQSISFARAFAVRLFAVP